MAPRRTPLDEYWAENSVWEIMPSRHEPNYRKCISCKHVIHSEIPGEKLTCQKSPDFSKMETERSTINSQDFTRVHIVRCALYDKRKNVFGA